MDKANKDFSSTLNSTKFPNTRRNTSTSRRFLVEKFNFDLIREYGWYSPSNSSNPNLNGVSRDHMISVQYGFENGIDPKIISHPANCRLILQTENFKKRNNCSITIEELIDRIDRW